MDSPISIEIDAPAKINLGLHIVRRRPDGFHDLETVFLRIGWADRLLGRPADEITLTCTDPDLPTDERNLVVRAALRLREALDETRGAALHLEKRVPYGAGLGGGSSDAAATLRLLGQLWDRDLDASDMHAHAAALGADVPFFLDGEAAYATGRGDVLQPLVDPTTGKPYIFPFTLVVVKPSVAVSTAEAFGRVRPRSDGRCDLRAVVTSNDLGRWRADLVNDFEAPLLARRPEIRAVRDELLDAGAGYAALSGSGSAVFGVFEHLADADAAARQMTADDRLVWRSVGPQHGG